MNRKQRRAAARGAAIPSRQEFERDLRAVVEGRPSNEYVVAFWEHFARTGDVVAAIATDDGVAVIRDRKDGAR